MRLLDKAAALAGLAAERGPGCRMCELVSEGTLIAASEHAVAILDRYASRPGHVLVVLRRHAERIAEVGWPEYQGLQRHAWEMCRALETVLTPRRIYVAALGSASPIVTSFPHLHIHVVPLADGGEADRPAEVFTWTNGVYVFDDLAEELALRDRLRAAL